MLEFAEKAYFFELERKTKLQAALSFPISVTIAGTALLGFSLNEWQFRGLNAVWASIPICLALISLIFFIWNVAKFLIGRTYRYIWTAEDALTHYEKLMEFSKEFPDAPDADRTFKDQLTRDLASFAARNARLNDSRSANLYYANIAAFCYILSGLLSAGIVTIAGLV